MYDLYPRPVDPDAEPTLTDRVFDWLTEQIVEGGLRPGQWVSENEVAGLLGVSRTPVHEAFRQFAHEGLLEIRRRRGTVLAELDAKEADDLYRARQLVEEEMARLAVEQMSDADIEELAEIVDELKRALGDRAAVLLSIRRLWQLLIDRCPNQVIREIVATLWRRSIRMRGLLLALPAGQGEMKTFFEEFLDAARGGDPEAAARVMASQQDKIRRILLEEVFINTGNGQLTPESRPHPCDHPGREPYPWRFIDALQRSSTVSSAGSSLLSCLHFIDGEEVPSLDGRTFETVNPATGLPLATVAFGGSEDVDRAVEAGRRAFDHGAWSKAAPAERAACLRRIANAVRDRIEEIAHIEALDAGKPIAAARSDISGAASILEYAGTLPENVRGQVFAQASGYLSYSRREPYGVVGAIAPWNFPFQIAVAKTASALALGNSVVLKMAEQTPLSTSLYALICAEAGLPAGVLNVVHGDGETTGRALAEHPRVPKLTFTGSTNVGRQLIRAGAETIKSCHLELGGKSPNIVFDDADLEAAINGSLFTSFWNSGQVCSSGSRLLVHRAVADELLTGLADRARDLTIGDPLSESTRLGPLITEGQLKRVGGYVDSGSDAGASVLVGGRRPAMPPEFAAGFFFEPTIFVDVDREMKIAQEEIFGPVLSVLQFETDEEAIAIANSVAFGLAATLWTNQLDRALSVSEQLEAGVIWTNWPHGGGIGVHVPYEGHKHSGLGEDGGLEVISTFTKLKVHHVRFGAPGLSF